ncbi:MAG: hypothetical protein GWM90_00310, partial [Gemmatimonadetes bacterium]|nr:hypothetical protein [Gemmatimonadota bacterium]NIU72071.1 hypothetical protein [Gammaproteobacteria bacterium]NIV54096.1 hypothetical protein [Actinomycetota bacterium]NIQ51968.1 hypothetical protein [Gemmatimonadota bacterium]NIV85375.1 hypothetical protein [Actinomycetota bacterium]
GPFANVYDLGNLVEEGPENARVARIPVPNSPELEARRRMGAGGIRGYHDFYVAYHPDSGQDRFYGGGAGGYYVYDITDLDSPE